MAQDNTLKYQEYSDDTKRILQWADVVRYQIRPDVAESRDFTPFIEQINKERAKNGQSLWGDSKYDYGIRDFEDLNRLDDLRANNQPGVLQLLNGIGKMTTTAATTFVDGTLGALWGVGQGFYNMFDDNDKTTFMSGLWDNAVNRAMMNIQDKMEELLPNYYTSAEMTDPWYQHIFSANFLGDKLLKNAGFTIGAMATMAVPGFNSGLGVGKLIKGATQIFGGGAKALRNAENVGKYATILANSFISANGEANIEAYHATTSFLEPELETLEQKINDGKNEAERLRQQAIESGVAPSIALAEYNRRIEFLNQLEKEKRADIEARATEIGNNTWKGNVIALMVSHNLEFGRMLRGGYGMSKGLNNILLRNGEKEVSQQAFGRAIAEGTANAAVRETKHNGLKIAGNWIKNMATEGTEEMVQNLIATEEQIKATAELNKKANKFKSDEEKYSLFASSINPEITEEYTNTFKAVSKAWDDNFGTIEKRGWEEFFLGALTGGLGTLSIRRQDVRNGSNRVTVGWQGGLVEAIRDARESRKDDEVKLEQIKKLIDDPKLIERTKRATASISIAQDMDEALQNDDVFRFKNSELMALANDALRFKNEGLIDAYKSFYESIANGLSEEDIEHLKLLTSQAIRNENVDTKASYQTYLDDLDDDKIKKLYQDKAKSNLSKINNVLTNYDNLYTKYYDKFRKSATEEQQNLIDFALQDIAANQALVQDLNRRKTQLIAQSAPQSEINKIDKTINEINDDVEKSLKDPQHKLITLEKIQQKMAKRLIGQDKETTKERYKNASSLQDILDTYFYNKTADREVNNIDNLFSNTSEEAENTFLEALNETEDGAQRRKLEKFLPFISNIKTLRDVVQNLLDSIPNANERNTMDKVLTNFLDKNIESYLNDENDDFSNIAEKLRHTINNMSNTPAVQALKPIIEHLATQIEDIDNITNSNREIERKLESLKNNITEDAENTTEEETETSENEENIEENNEDEQIEEEEGEEKEEKEINEEESKDEEKEEEKNDETENVEDNRTTEEKIWENILETEETTYNGFGQEISNILPISENLWARIVLSPFGNVLYVFNNKGDYSRKDDNGIYSTKEFKGVEDVEKTIKKKHINDPVVAKYFSSNVRTSSDRVSMDIYEQVKGTDAKENQTFSVNGWINLFKEEGFDFDLVSNEVLPHLTKQIVDDKIYIGAYCKEDRDTANLNKYVYAGYRISDEIVDAIKNKFSNYKNVINKHIVEQDGTNYLIVGPMIFRSSNEDNLAMIDNIKEHFKDKKTNNKTGIVFTEDITTTINEISEGSVVYEYTDGKKQGEFGTDINELLNSKDSIINPCQFNTEDIKFEHIKSNTATNIESAYLGETYIILKNTNVPIKVSTITFNDIFDTKGNVKDLLNVDSTYGKNLTDAIKNLINSKSEEDFVNAFTKFGKYFHITSVSGNGIFLTRSGTSVYAKVGGKYITDKNDKIKYASFKGKSFKNTMLAFLNSVNPRIATNHLDKKKQNAKEMIDSGLIRVRVARLGTINKGIFVNPLINQNGTIVEDKNFNIDNVKNKHKKPIGKHNEIINTVYITDDVMSDSFAYTLDSKKQIAGPNDFIKIAKHLLLNDGYYEIFPYDNNIVYVHLPTENDTTPSVLRLSKAGSYLIETNIDSINNIIDTYIQSLSEESTGNNTQKTEEEIDDVLNLDEDQDIDDNKTEEETIIEKINTNILQNIDCNTEQDIFDTLNESEKQKLKVDFHNKMSAEFLASLRTGWSESALENIDDFLEYLNNCKQ